MCLDCELLRTQNESLAHELQGAIEGYEIESSNRRKAEREAHRLKRELNGSTTKESQRVKEICEYHDQKWRELNPKARGLEYPMDGVNAAAVRKWIRRGKDEAWIKRVIDGAFLSDFHRQKPGSYLTLQSLLGDENKTNRHLATFEEKQASRLLDEGLRLVKESLNPVLEDPIDRVLRALETAGLPWCVPPRTKEAGVWLSVCPACRGELRVTVDLADWAHLQCGSCDVLEVLGRLWLEPADLVRRFDPVVVPRLVERLAA